MLRDSEEMVTKRKSAEYSDERAAKATAVEAIFFEHSQKKQSRRSILVPQVLKNIFQVGGLDESANQR